MKRRDYMRAAVVVINCFAILLMVYVITSSAAYTVIVGDDFPNSVRIGAFRVSFFEYIAASLHYMKDMYFDWQGTYFAMFIQAFLSPLNNYGLIQLRIVMILNALLFFGTLFGMTWAALGFVLKEKKELHIKLTVFTLILFAILDANVFTEIFFWYCGASAYGIPFSFAILSVMILFKVNSTHCPARMQTLLCICASVLLFLASGGPLVISGTACYAILLLTVGFYIASKKFAVKNVIVLAAGIVGALINVIAPGNFSRHEYGNGGSWHLVQCVKWTVKIVWGETGRLTKETMFGVVLVAMLLLGIFMSKKVQSVLRVYGIISILALGIGYVTVFPVVLGYGGPEFPNRCYFILDVVLVLSLLNFVVFIGCCLDLWADIYANKSVWAVLLIVLFNAFLFCPETLSESALMKVAESNHNGSYRNYYEQCVAIYDYLDNCPEEDVVLEMPEYIENFECFYFDEDETGWVNVGLAQYYHKNSVKRKAE